MDADVVLWRHIEVFAPTAEELHLMGLGFGRVRRITREEAEELYGHPNRRGEGKSDEV